MILSTVRESPSVEVVVWWRRRLALAALCGSGAGLLWSHSKRERNTASAERMLARVSAAPRDADAVGYVCSLRSFEPLIVVDGVALSPGATAIDQATVVSMDFMEKGRARAVYGARASDGAVLIATRAQHPPAAR